MSFARLPINTLMNGVGRQAPSKRLSSEAENIDNCLVTVEKSVEKRPPLSAVYSNGETFLDISYFNNHVVHTAFNPDSYYFHFLDIDGSNRYCIVINRAGFTFSPRTEGTFKPTSGNAAGSTINLDNLITVFRIEPTEWIQEPIDLTVADENTSNGFNRAIFEYITTGTYLAQTNYFFARDNYITAANKSIKETFGSIDFGVGIILWNKLITLDFAENNAAFDLNADNLNNNTFYNTLNKTRRIHSGDKVNYKTADGFLGGTNQYTEDNSSDPNYWVNVRDDIDYSIDPDTLEEEELGQNLENFSSIPQFPVSEIIADFNDANGLNSTRMLYHLYDFPHTIRGGNSSIDFNLDDFYISTPLPATQRDENVYGFGKIYYARSPYLTFPVGFYRVTRYSKTPYLERIRTEDENSVLDYRTFPLQIYKDLSTGVWKVKHLPLQPRRNGTNTTNPGPAAVTKKESIQSMAFWKNRLWIATDSTIFTSQTNNPFNFWISDIGNIVETDPIDIESGIGSYNKLAHIVPFQDILFVTTGGSIQYEVRGGSNEVGISPFNVEFVPTSFYSTAKLNEPQKLGNNIFYTDSSKMYMYIGGKASGGEFATSMEMSPHCRGYLPNTIGSITTSAATNSILFTDKNNLNHLYFYTLRFNGDKIMQNAFYKWVLDPNDKIMAIKTYEKDLYIVAQRPSGIATGTGNAVCVVYFCSLESVPIETPMLDWLVKILPNKMTYQTDSQTTRILLPYYDPSVSYIILAPGTEWGNLAYTSYKLTTEQIGTFNANGRIYTTVTLPGDLTTGPVYAGRSYLMNVELSTQVRRAEDTAMVYEGVLNLKRITTKHYYTGQYDVVIQRKNRAQSKVTYIPTNLNSIVTRTDQLQVDKVGEQFSKILSYSEDCKIFIQSEYPTPCNISNIEILANFRSRNTSIE